MDARGVAHGSIYLTVQNLLSALIGVLGYSFLTRNISQVDMGAVVGLTLLASLLQLLPDLGLSSSLAKFVSELRGRGEDASGYFISALFLRLPLSILFSALLFLFSETLSLTLFRTGLYSSSMRLLAVDVLLISNLPLLNSALLGAGRLKIRAANILLSAALLAWRGISGKLCT